MKNMFSDNSIEENNDYDNEDLLTLCALVEDYKIELNESNKKIKELKNIIISNEEIKDLQYNQINELSDSLLLLDSELLETQNNLLLKDNEIILLKEQLNNILHDTNDNNLINIKNIDKVNEYESIIESQIKEIRNNKKIIFKNNVQIEEYEELLNKQQTELLDLGFKLQEFEKKQNILKNDSILNENPNDIIINSTISTIYNNTIVDENIINSTDQINKSHTPNNIILSILNQDIEEYNANEFDIINKNENLNKSLEKWKKKENINEIKNNNLSNNNWIEGGKKKENYERQYINTNNTILMNKFDDENKTLPPLPPSGSTFYNIKQKANNAWKSVSSSRSSSPSTLTLNNLNNINSKKCMSYQEFEYHSEDTNSSICSAESNNSSSKLRKKLSMTRGKTIYPIILQEGIELELE